MSLVSLMVGMVISVTATVGLLSIYRNSLMITTTATQGLINDSQLATLLLRTGASVEDAGYGVASATFGTYIVPINGAALSGTSCSPLPSVTLATCTLGGAAGTLGTGFNGVVWATLTGATTQCAGFVAPSTGGLVYLEPVTCTNAAAWNTLTWPSTTVASGSTSPVLFTIAQQSCAPYGITGTSGKYTITLNTTNSIGATVSSVQCLINFQ
jgi:hypothetical protein